MKSIAIVADVRAAAVALALASFAAVAPAKAEGTGSFVLTRYSGVFYSDALATSTNDCVEHTSARRFDNARSACNAALSIAVAARSGLPIYSYAQRDEAAADLAVAYANRAVLHSLTGEHTLAEKDLKRASRLAPGAAFVGANLEALRAATATRVASNRAG